MLDSITSGLVGVSSRDFFQSTPREAGVINWVQFLQCPSPKICDGRKIAQNFSQFLTTFDFDHEYLRNVLARLKSEKYLINYNLSQVGQKKTGELWSTYEKVIEVNIDSPSGHFSGHNISALKGCCALKFLHALETDQGYLAHTPTGWGSPQKM